MKNIICVLFALCFGHVLMAQTKSEATASPSEIDTSAAYREALFRSGRVRFGFIGGYTQGNLYGKEIDYIFADSKTTALASYHLGIVVNSQIGKYFSLKHELLFNQRRVGVRLSDSLNGEYSSTFKMLCMDLYPASPTFCFKGLQMYVGPYISLLADASLRRKNENGNYYTDKSIFGEAGNNESETKYLQKFDFGISAGIEYLFPSGLSVGIRYTRGFTDIFQYANSYTLADPKTSNIKIHNQALMFSLAYLLTGGKDKK